MKNPTRTSLLKHPLSSVLAIFASVVTVIGCGYSLLTDHSVRFSERTGRAFYRLPPLPLMYDSTTGREISANEFENYDYAYGYDNEESYNAQEKRDKQTLAEVDKISGEAWEAIDGGDLMLAKKRWEEFLAKTELTLPESSDMEGVRQQERNTATDMLDAIASIKQGSKPGAVKAYLDARVKYDASTSEPINVGELRSASPRDRNLDDNWLYLEGAVAYKSGDKEAAGERFDFLYTHYPQSEKREAALYMKAKIALETSYSFDAKECGFSGGKLDPYYFAAGDDKTDSTESTQIVEVDEKCRDSKWGMALNTFQLLIASYPNGRYVDDANGWIAFIHQVGGQRAESLAGYYRMLGHPTSWRVRLEAKKSLQILGHHFDDETLDRVERILERDVNGAMAYAYHRIYNEAVDYSDQKVDPWMYSNDNWSEVEKEEGRVDKLVGTGKHELERVAKFATKMMQRYPHSSVSAGFLTRVAEAQLELENFDDAVRLASRAIELGVAGDLLAQALWVKGSGEHHGRRFAAAETTFKRLLAEFPKS
jgi:TolA-binding protein